VKTKKRLIAFFLSVALFGSAADTQSHLASQIGELEAALAKIEARTAPPNRFSFEDADIRDLLEKMTKISSELESESKKENESKKEASAITDSALRYLNVLSTVHTLYAVQAHLPGVETSNFSFDTLDQYNLKLSSTAGRPVMLQKPFNARNVGGDMTEFFITAEENQMSEFLALQNPQDEIGYENLIQLLSLRESYVNLWSIQRLSYIEIPLHSLSSCAPNLMSFRLRSNDPKSNDAYQQLIGLDRYNGITEKLPEALEATQGFTLASQAAYVSVLTRLFANTPEFKTYSEGVSEDQISNWWNNVAESVLKNESDDWNSDPKNSESVLGASSQISDGMSSQQVAMRMAQVVIQRHAEAAESQIEKTVTTTLKIEASRDLHAHIEAALQEFYAPALSRLTSALQPVFKDVDDHLVPASQTTHFIEKKTEEIALASAPLLDAIHDHILLSETTGNPVTADWNAQAQEAAGNHVYLSDGYRYFVADSAVFKAYFMDLLQTDKFFWKALNSNSTSKKNIAQFFADVDQGMNNATKNSDPLPPRNQLGQELIQQIQKAAQTALNSAGNDPSGEDLLKKAFNKIPIFTAKKPADLANTSALQQELVDEALNEAYSVSPLLGVKWKRPGFFNESKTLLYYIYSDGLPKLPALMREALQYAFADIQGKVEDACQANLNDPSKDQRFKNMFLGASHLRQIIDQSSGDEKQNASLEKFDDDLVKKTQTLKERIDNRYVDPAILVLGVLLGIIGLIIAFPVSLTAGLATFLAGFASLIAVANWSALVLSCWSVYVHTSVDFYEKPAVLKYQDALASSMISGQDPFDDWNELKKKGLLGDTDRITVDQARDSLTRTQALSIAETPLNVMFGVSAVKETPTAIAKIIEMFGGHVPPFVNLAKPAVAHEVVSSIHSTSH
jgi:hypothetical protein